MWLFSVFVCASIICVTQAFRGISRRDEAPPDCEWVRMRDEDFDETLFCRFRTIGTAEKTFANLSFSEIDRITSLNIVCSDILFFESSLESTGGFLGHLRRLRELSIEYCKIRHVPADVLIGSSNLRHFTLRTHNTDWSAMSMEFHGDSFRGLQELRGLDLSDNNIWTFPSHAFCPLLSLTFLNLSRNRIQDVLELGFSDWGNGPSAPGRTCNVALEVLDVSQNELVSLPDNGFTSLRSLQKLYLHDNKITVLADRAFVGLVSLQVLNVSCNRLSALPPELFQSSRDIKEIHLQNNSISVLAPGLLEGLDQLQTLDLSHNQLTNSWVNRDTFSGLVRLVVLNLSNNMISRIDSHVFQDLYSLQILRLERNNIEVITEGAFSTLSNLHGLTLSNNKISRIEAHHFSGLYVLNQLYLSHNEIKSIHPRAFENCTNLQDLELSANQLETVPASLSSLLYLKTLDLGENKITKLSNDSFQGLEQLYRLSLISNRLTNITKDTFSALTSLQILNLAGNRIKHVEQNAFRSNPTLQAVRLDGNLLTDINGVFASMGGLVWLNISDNRLQWFDYAFVPKSLKWLDMHKNNISELGNYFEIRKEIQIQMLDASFNKLTEISDLSIPESVEILYLNDNQIHTIKPNTFLQKPNLTRVVLYSNKLHHLDLNALVLHPVPESRDLPQFFIGSNPFHCDCTMEWLQRINQLNHIRHHPRVMDLESVICKLTHTRGGAERPLLELQPSQFLCQYESHCFALCHCCDFDACDCEMTCPDNCTCYHDHLWASNVVDCSNRGYTHVPPKIPMDATEIYLDGNNFGDLGSHVFIGKKKLQVLYLNASNIQTLHNRTFNGLPSLRVLHIENNKIQELRGFEFDQMENLRELYLDRNEISFVGNQTFSKMKALEVLHVENNKIADFSPLQLPSSAKISKVVIDSHSWACDCESVARFQEQLRVTRAEGLSLNTLHCSSGAAKETFEEVIARCGEISSYDGQSRTDDTVQSDSIYKTVIFQGEYFQFAIAILVAVLIISLITVLYFVFRHDVSLWLYSRYGIRIFQSASSVSETVEERDRLYDAYIVYSIKDADFVNRGIACELEQEGHSLCLHYRDLQLMSESSFLTESILSASEASRRVLIIFSLSFLQQEWDIPEFRASLQAGLHHIPSHLRRRKIIFLVTTDLANVNIDPEIQDLLRTCTVVSWGEKRFREKLKFAMPDVGSKRKKRNNNTVKTSMNKSVEPVKGARYTAAPTNVDMWYKYGGGGGGGGGGGIDPTAPPATSTSDSSQSSQRTEEEIDSGSQQYDYTTRSHSYVSIDGRVPAYNGSQRHVYSTIPDPLVIGNSRIAPGRTYFV